MQNVLTKVYDIESPTSDVSKLNFHIHSHPSNTPIPSGFNGTLGDIQAAMTYIRKLGYHINFGIFIPSTGQYIKYSANSKKDDFIK